MPKSVRLSFTSYEMGPALDRDIRTFILLYLPLTVPLGEGL